MLGCTELGTTTHLAFGKASAQALMFIPCSPSGVTSHLTSPPSCLSASSVAAVSGCDT